MVEFKDSDKKINISIDSKELSHKQVRLLKRCLTTLVSAVSTTNESEYFESSSDLLKIATILVKEGNFPKQNNINHQIPYRQQVLEYSFDELNEFLTSGESLYDN